MAQRDVEFPQKMRIPIFRWFFWGKKKIELSCIILLAFCPVSSTGILAPSKAAHGSFWGEAPPLPLAGGAVEFFPVLVEGIRISKAKKWPTKSSTRCRSFIVDLSKKLFVVFQCGHLSIRKQSAKRNDQEGATKRQRRVIQLSLGSNEALSFGGYSLGSAMTVVARNLSPGHLKAFAKKISWLKAC